VNETAAMGAQMLVRASTSRIKVTDARAAVSMEIEDMIGQNPSVSKEGSEEDGV
jgi:hypothetical protein